MLSTSLLLRRRGVLALGSALSAVALAAAAPAAPHHGPSRGAVFTASNDAVANEVVVYRRFLGFLQLDGTYATGGAGSGGGLGNQGALVLDRHGRHLFVVNAGSDSLSVFDVDGTDLALLDVEPSGGVQPISVTVHGDLVYVLNAGGTGNIAGFRLGHDGDLMPLAGSMRPLSSDASGPAQIAFTPDGDFLVVSEKATNSLVTYAVDDMGLPGMPVVNASEGPTPFGFDFGRHGALLVSEAAGGMPGMSSVSSYDVRHDGTLAPIVSSLATGQTAACWLVTTPHRPFAYTTNTGSDNLTGLAVWKGQVKLLQDDGVAAPAGDAPIDAAVDRRGRFLFVLNAADDTISTYYVGLFGGLLPLQTVDGLPASVNGLAAR